MTPDEVDEDNAQYQRELTIDQMTPQRCPAGVHADWAADCEHAHSCPWCEITRLNKLVDSQRKLITAHGKTPPPQCTAMYADTQCELNEGHAGNHRRRVADDLVRSWPGR